MTPDPKGPWMLHHEDLTSIDGAHVSFDRGASLSKKVWVEWGKPLTVRVYIMPHEVPPE